MNDFLNPVYRGKSPPLTSIPGSNSGSNMLGSIISGVGSLANGVINAIQGNKNNKRQIEFAKWSQQQQERFAWDMFRAENRYNDPSAQAERLLRAGLNPALMYGSGVGSTGEASGGQTLSAVQPNTSPVPSFLQNLVGSNPFESLAALLGTQKAKSDIENTNMDTQKKESEKNKLDKEVDILKIDEEKQKYDTVISQVNSKYHEEIVRQGIEKEYQEINNLVQNAVNAAKQNELMQSEIDLNKALENLDNWKSYEISQLIKPQIEAIRANVKKALADARQANASAYSTEMENDIISSISKNDRVDAKRAELDKRIKDADITGVQYEQAQSIADLLVNEKDTYKLRMYAGILASLLGAGARVVESYKK